MDFDAVLLLSFGGPEGPEQVRPFLENVTRGRNVPPERLDDVAEHYLHFGGVSPINGINRALIAQLRRLPWTCRSISATATGSPTSRTPLPRCATTGFVVRRCSPPRRGADTPAAPSMPRTSPGPGGRPGRMRPNWSNCGHTSTIRCSSRYSPTTSPAAARYSAAGDARLVFTAHSVPVAADERLGPKLYSRQVRYAAGLVAAAAGYADYDLAWQSRSGPPQVPWLEPDVADHRCRARRDGHHVRHRLPDRFRRRPHRGGVGSRHRVAPTGRRGGHSARAGRARPTPTRDSPGWRWI